MDARREIGEVEVVATVLFAAKQGVDAGLQEAGKEPRSLGDAGFIAEEGNTDGFFATNGEPVGSDRQPFATVDAVL